MADSVFVWEKIKERFPNIEHDKSNDALLSSEEHRRVGIMRARQAEHDRKVRKGLIHPNSPRPGTQPLPSKKGGKQPWQKGRKNPGWQVKPWNKKQLQRSNPGWEVKPWNKKRPQRKKVDRFAEQKKWTKTWLRAYRIGATNSRGYSVPQGRQQGRYVLKNIASAKGVRGLQHETRSLVRRVVGEYFPALQTTERLVSKPTVNAHLEVRVKGTNVRKVSLTTYDKVYYYYTLRTPLTMYAHKAFILLEMQLNSTLVRTKLVPYLFLVRDLCFYRLVQINRRIVNNPYYVVSLYDSVSIPVYLHNYMYYRQYRIQYYPTRIGHFFKQYWAHFTNYTNNKVWLLSNFIASDIAAEAVVFDYPNIALYMGPFKRFTKLYYKNHPYAPIGRHRYLNHTHTVLKLKLFEYAAFYR